MSDSLFTGVLTISLLAAGALAFGTDVANDRHTVTAPVVTLPTVTIVAHRAAPINVVLLPEVQITGHRHAAAVQVAAL